MPLMDPWYDYLAIPYAPLVLLVQVAALFVRRGLRRWSISIACTAVIAAMFLYVESLPVRADEGANIGAGVLFLWLIVSVLLLIVGIVRDGVVAAIRRMRFANRSAKPS
jgi:hypothetical protein